MKSFRSSIFILLLLLLGGLVIPARAQAAIQVVSDAASLTFPDSIIFNAGFQSGADISSVVLEYGVNELTCGSVEAKAFPTFTPGAQVQVEWTWEMRQSGSLPPGTSVWWRWQVSDASGAQFTSPTKTVLWLDDTHPWQVITGEDINLHYYSGGDSFGQQLHTAATQALLRLSQDVGVSTDSPVNIYIYANTSDLQDAVLYEPSWAGGEAFAQNNIVIIGISPDQLEWGKSTEAHELSHVLVGHLTFSCLGFVPTWLNEGLAVYSGGGPQEYQKSLFNQAIAGNSLMSLRSLGGNFPESEAGYLAYAESYSVVNFLIKTYGREKMTTLLLDLRDGATADEALMAVYGFNVDGLEDAWRSSLGLEPQAGSSEPTPALTPTAVPTFVPIGAAPVAAAGLSTPHPTALPVPPTVIPTATAALSTEGSSTQQPGLNLRNYTSFLNVALACLVIAILLAGLAIFLIVRRQNRRSK
jgi:hypothetical protein